MLRDESERPVWVLIWYSGSDHEVAPDEYTGGIFATEEAARAEFEKRPRWLRAGRIDRVIPQS